MKSAYELAMERLNLTAPTIRLSEEQKRQIAEIDARFQAKIAEKEIYARSGIASAQAAGDVDGAAELERRLAADKKSLQAEMEAAKEKVRQKGP